MDIWVLLTCRLEIPTEPMLRPAVVPSLLAPTVMVGTETDLQNTQNRSTAQHSLSTTHAHWLNDSPSRFARRFVSS